MRHAKDPDLDRVDGLLARCGTSDRLRERNKGTFRYQSRGGTFFQKIETAPPAHENLAEILALTD